MELLVVPIYVSLKVWTRKCLMFYGICDFLEEKKWMRKICHCGVWLIFLPRWKHQNEIICDLQ
jgi:hypothetical protein